MFPDPTASYFSVLDVPVAVDDATLSARFRELSRRFHPDRYARADAATQAEALAAAALLNDAYRTLRDPFTRAAYLLQRERGIKPGAGGTNPPRALFSEVLELQEALLEFQTGDASQRPALEAAQQTFGTAYADLQSRLDDAFRRYDDGETEAALDTLQEIGATRGYLRRVLDNLEKALGASA